MGCSTNDQRTMEENTNPKNEKWNTVNVTLTPSLRPPSPQIPNFENFKKKFFKIP
jgi:hypothetical protein